MNDLTKHLICYTTTKENAERIRHILADRFKYAPGRFWAESSLDLPDYPIAIWMNTVGVRGLELNAIGLWCADKKEHENVPRRIA